MRYGTVIHAAKFAGLAMSHAMTQVCALSVSCVSEEFRVDASIAT